MTEVRLSGFLFTVNVNSAILSMYCNIEKGKRWTGTTRRKKWRREFKRSGGTSGDSNVLDMGR